MLFFGRRCGIQAWLCRLRATLLVQGLIPRLSLSGDGGVSPLFLVLFLLFGFLFFSVFMFRLWFCDGLLLCSHVGIHS